MTSASPLSAAEVRSVGIAGFGTYAPERRLTNAELEQMVETNDQWIVERTGIKERRVAAEGESTATLATEAAKAAIKDAGLTPDDIDVLIVATTTPDYIVPATSALVADALGLRCGAFDLNAACAGFAYASVVASSLIQSGGAKTALVVGAETISRFVDYGDRNTCVIFGDGAGAAVLRASSSPGLGILAWDLGVDGSGWGLIHVAAGGSAKPATTETIAAGEHYVRMNGNEVFRRAVRAVVDSANAVLEKAGVTADEVDVFVPHQANVRIIEAVGTRLGIPAEKTVVNIDKYGNTSAASIPLALADALAAGRVKDGDLVLLSGFGAGMTWASALMRWGK